MFENFFLECHEWIELEMKRCVGELVERGGFTSKAVREYRDGLAM